MMLFRGGCSLRVDGQRMILGSGGEGERGRGSIRRRASPKGSADLETKQKDDVSSVGVPSP